MIHGRPVPTHPDDHYSRIAGEYATFRPRYPKALFAWLASIAPGHTLAWDVGTGSGQAAVALARWFSRVLATDLSAGQIKAAQVNPRVEYRVASAESSGLAERSVDLVTIAQALHWFNVDTFFHEARRVLVGGGVVAAWTYGVIRMEDPALNDILHRFYYDEIGPWWPPNRQLVEVGYRTISFPFEEISAPPFEMQVSWSLPDLVGYIGTWSAVSRYRETQGTDPVAGLEARLRPLWGDPMAAKGIDWPLSMRVGRTD
jgi:SAM-dependent methyltransferase